MESIRCHFFNGVDQNGKKPIWVKWNKVLASKEKGGIHGEDGKLNKNASHNHLSIWLYIVREMIHLKNNGMDLCGFIHKKMRNGFDTSFWQDVWRGEDDFKSAYPRVYALDTRKCINVAEKMTRENLGFSFCRNPRSGIEQAQFLHLLARLEGFNLVDIQDRWVWSLEGSGEFFIASVRKMIDDHWLQNVSTKTRWTNVVPIKINVHA
ncbi:hypothetical protein Tco_1488536 [Tanacetum coccineum]